MDRRALLAALGTVGVGGCLRLQGSGGTSTATATPTPPATDAATPTETATPSVTREATYPSGLTDDGANAFLFSSHVRTLSATSFHVQWTKLDRTSGTVERQREYRAGAGTALGTWTLDFGGPVEMYRVGEEGWWREQLGDGYTYGEDTRGFDVEWVTWARELRPLVEAAAWDAPERVDESRPAVWRVVATGVADGSVAPTYKRATTEAIERAVLRVDERGVIRKAQAIYTIDHPRRGRLTYESRYAVDGVGSTSVAEPEWLPTAKERAPTASATLTDDRRYLRFVVESGNRLEPGTALDLNDPDREPHTAVFVRLEEPLEPGTEAYLYTEQPREEGPSGQLSRGGRPATADPLALDDEYFLGVRRRATHYMDTIDVP